jgi:capsular exopolysaccharide synthesis family protein
MARNPQKSILVTSGSLGEGKTTVAINLAAAFAKARKKVVLIDADFYKPVIHSQLKLDNQRGLNEIIGNQTDWREVAKESGGIVVITSGKHPLASAAQLESNGMTQLLKNLEDEFDMIVLDAPPLFIADTQLLCTQVGGILLVVRQANTTAAAVRTMLDQLKLLGAEVLGVVLNRVPHKGTYYYGGYYRPQEEDPEETVDDVKASES